MPPRRRVKLDDPNKQLMYLCSLYKCKGQYNLHYLQVFILYHTLFLIQCPKIVYQMKLKI